MLSLSSWILFGLYFGQVSVRVTCRVRAVGGRYDIPSALDTQLQDYLEIDYDTYQFEFNLLYAIYSFPNIFLPFVGGYLSGQKRICM